MVLLRTANGRPTAARKLFSALGPKFFKFSRAEQDALLIVFAKYELYQAIPLTLEVLHRRPKNKVTLSFLFSILEMYDRDGRYLSKDLLKDPNENVRWRAVQLIDNDPRLAAVYEFLEEKDPSAQVREAARRALERINGIQGNFDVPTEENPQETKSHSTPRFFASAA